MSLIGIWLLGCSPIFMITLVYLGLPRCPKCGKRCKHTGIGGSEFTQFTCRKCEEVFWRRNKLFYGKERIKE